VGRRLSKGRPAAWLPAAALLVAIAGCSGGPGRTGGASAPSAATLPPPALTTFSLLGVRFLAPSTWPRHRVVSGPGDGQMGFAAPGAGHNEGAVFLQVSSCGACVDQGVITRSRANGVPDAAHVLAQEHAVGVRQISSTEWLFAVSPSPPGTVTAGALAIADDAGQLTGYAVLNATLPRAEAALARGMAESLRVPLRL
jgi:hypothetical protein